MNYRTCGGETNQACDKGGWCHTVRSFLLSRLSHAHSVCHIRLIAISPFQSRAAPQMIRSYLFNGYRRLSQQVPYFILPFALGELYHITFHIPTRAEILNFFVRIWYL